MGILNRMWASVWATEEQKKHTMVNEYRAEMHRKIEETTAKMLAAPTDIQREALKMGGPEFEAPEENSTGSVWYAKYQAAMQAAAHGQNISGLANYNAQQQLLIQQAQQTYGQYGQSLGGVSQGLAGSSIQNGISPTVMTVANTSSTGIVMGSTGTSTVTLTPVVFGQSDYYYTFYKALRGIEEVNAKHPDRHLKYDDDANVIRDARYFDEKNISLLSVLSFCLSNAVEPKGIVVLLENHGMTLVVHEGDLS